MCHQGGRKGGGQLPSHFLPTISCYQQCLRIRQMALAIYFIVFAIDTQYKKRSLVSWCLPPYFFSACYPSGRECVLRRITCESARV